MFYSYSATALALFAVTNVLAAPQGGAVTNSTTVSSSTTSSAAGTCPSGYAPKQQAAWLPCPNLASRDCATIRVPKDYSNPSGPTIPLRMIRYPANPASKAPKRSVIMNFGGPGESGIQALRAGGEFYQDLLGDNWHIVSFDPRAVGQTLPNTCQNLNRDISYNEDGTTDFVQKASDSRNNAIECAKKDPEMNLKGTTYTARDVKAIAEAQEGLEGQDGLIRYWGFSYGTLLGSTIAAMFPNETERMVLDGNINPQLYYNSIDEDSIKDFDGAVANFFNLCAAADSNNSGATKKCALNNLQPEGGNGNALLERYRTYVSSLTTSPRFGANQRIFDPMYLKNAADWTALATDLYKTLSTPNKKRQNDDTFNPNVTNQNTDSAISAIRCTDYQNSNANVQAAEFRRIEQAWTNASFFGGLAGTANADTCAAWNVRANEQPPLPFNVETKNGIQFVNTRYDPVTPLGAALESMKGFKGSGLIISDEAGHCTGKQGGAEGLTTLMRTYFNTGTVVGKDSPKELKLRTKTSDGKDFDSNPFTNPDVTGVYVTPSDQTQENEQQATTSSNKRSIDNAEISEMFKLLDSKLERMNKRQVTNTTASIPASCTPISTPISTPTSSSSVSITTTSSSVTSGTTSISSVSKPTTLSTSTPYTFTTTGTNTYSFPSGFTTPSGFSTSPYTTEKTKSGSTWAAWEPKPTTSNTWATWSTSSSKKPSSWSDPKPTAWDAWANQDDCVPVTTTFYDDVYKTTKTVVVAVPTRTVYLDYVNDVCETGITTKVVTVTATCDKGCSSKPTGAPQGYTTTAVYCSQCASPSTVTITIKATEWANAADPKKTTTATATGAKPTEWANVPDASKTTSNGGKPTEWANVADPSSKTTASSGKPTDWANVPAAASGSGSATGSWADWQNPTATGPKVAKYTGGAAVKTVSVGAVFALFAGMLML